ncbi:MAG: insulinase family protein [Planctomycetes bacterium]|nr:insulinase family protein [Planctomycetota bacterium]
MKLSVVDNPLGEPVLHGTAASGLHVLINPRPEYERTFAALGTNFGSVDRVSAADGQPVPEGLAHFLEHKLFEDAEGDVSDRFAQLGASTNAMTGFCGTTYIVSTVAEPLPSIDLLLDFVQDPWFTDALVQKEQGIIAQEIRMYDDDPDWRIFFGLLGCLYARHPVRDNIAGTVESIAEIDAATLRRCYDLFYHPTNLCLTVSGPVDPGQLAALVEADQAARPADGLPPHVRPPIDEPAGVVTPRWTERLPVSRPRLLLGIKETVLGGDGLSVARRQLTTRVLLDVLFGRSSRAFQDLYGEGLLDETFAASYSGEPGFGFTTLGGDTDEPERLEQRLRDVFARALRDGIDPGAHRRIRNKLYGMLLRATDSPETVCYELLSDHFRDAPPFCALSLVDSITEDDLLQRLREHVRDDAIAVSVVLPTES